MSAKLYICYSINDFFVREAGISLIGMLDNNPDYGPDEIFFLDYGIHPLNKEKLDGIAAKYGKRITYLKAKPVTDHIKREFPQLKGWRGTMAPNAKAFVEQIFPDYVERLLFIDADTVVAGSLSGLQDLDMEGKALGVVPANQASVMIRKGKQKLTSGNQFYFNSGVLLFNLPAWREEDCPGMIRDTLNKEIDLEMPDQALLNNAIPQRLITKLPLKYNYLSHYIHPRQVRNWLRVGHYYSQEEIDEAIHNPVIIHYLGGWVMARPWYRNCRSSLGDVYLHYKSMSPWKDSPLMEPYEKTHPPKGFREKYCFWMLKQYGVSRSFLWVYLLDVLVKPVLFCIFAWIEVCFLRYEKRTDFQKRRTGTDSGFRIYGENM